MSDEQNNAAETSEPQELDDIFVDSDTEIEAESMVEEAHSPEELGRLLEDARGKADDHWDLVVRTQAELDNLKKRHQRELENARKFGVEKLVNQLFGVWDSLELGLSAAQHETGDLEKLLEGTELTLKMLVTAMNNMGVEQIDPQGEKFNPEQHQAIVMEAAEGVESNTVTAVVQKGYSLNGRLVRPAMVKVSQ